MQNRKTLEKNLKKIYAHLLNLDLHRFLNTRVFFLFTIENDIDEIWDSSVSKSVEDFADSPFSNNCEVPKQFLNFQHLPGAWIDSFFMDFLVSIYSEKEDSFPEIITSFLASYCNWIKNENIDSPVPLYDELIEKIAIDLFDLGYSETDVEAYFKIYGLKFLPCFYSQSEKTVEFSSICQPPVEIIESLKKFRESYPEPNKIAFIMMQFGNTQEHSDILKSIKKTLDKYGLIGIRADDKIFHNDNFYNILTYLHGCDFGIAVFEKISRKSFNPNVSLEIGYLFALNKQVCLLKEKSIQTLPSDLIGKLYQEFDIKKCDISINNVVRNWMADKGFCDSLEKSIISTEYYEKMASYLKETGLTQLKINNQTCYEEAKEILDLNIKKLDKPFLEDMNHVGFLTSDYQLTCYGKKFVNDLLFDYLGDN